MGTAATRTISVELDRDECLSLVGTTEVGRVGFDDGEGPTVFPVNFALDGECVLFRTTLTGRLYQSLTAIPDAAIRIAFEVDWINQEQHIGWSVLLRGGAEAVSVEEGEKQEWPQPWPAGEREAYVRLRPTSVCGRRLKHA
ncbi:pyridoxamine 5'-phosphate oxidase family protein [Actinomadura fulvescens]